MDKLEYIPGDLVMTKTEPNDFTPNGVVCEFVSYCNRNKVFVRVAKGVDTFFLEKEQITPIPLTPEILEKNGLKKPDGFDSYWLGKIGLLQDGEEWHSAVGNTKMAIILGDIRYVHQLQHLLYGLKINSEMEV